MLNPGNTIPALVVAGFGVVVFVDTRHQEAMGRNLSRARCSSVADEVELRIESGRGGTSVDEVEVVFPTGTDPHQHATLIANLGDPEGAEPGRVAGPAREPAMPLPWQFSTSRRTRRSSPPQMPASSPATRQLHMLPSA